MRCACMLKMCDTRMLQAPVESTDDTVYYDCFDLKIVYERNRTGFEETKDYPIEINGVIAGRYQVGLSSHVYVHVNKPVVS
jgi:hypothetical protein